MAEFIVDIGYEIDYYINHTVLGLAFGLFIEWNQCNPTRANHVYLNTHAYETAESWLRNNIIISYVYSSVQDYEKLVMKSTAYVQKGKFLYAYFCKHQNCKTI